MLKRLPVEFQWALAHLFLLNVGMCVQLEGGPALSSAREAPWANSPAAEKFPSIQQHVAAVKTTHYQLDPKMFSCIPDISGSNWESQDVRFTLNGPEDQSGFLACPCLKPHSKV